MKTILVVFTQDKKRSVELANLARDKKYCFVTEDDIAVGDFLASDYKGYLLVTDVIEHAYKYYNYLDGSLKDEVGSHCNPIKEIELHSYEDYSPELRLRKSENCIIAFRDSELQEFVDKQIRL